MHIERFSQAHHQLEAVYIVFKQPRAKWRAEKQNYYKTQNRIKMQEWWVEEKRREPERAERAKNPGKKLLNDERRISFFIRFITASPFRSFFSPILLLYSKLDRVHMNERIPDTQYPHIPAVRVSVVCICMHSPRVVQVTPTMGYVFFSDSILTTKSPNNNAEPWQQQQEQDERGKNIREKPLQKLLSPEQKQSYKKSNIFFIFFVYPLESTRSEAIFCVPG